MNTVTTAVHVARLRLVGALTFLIAVGLPVAGILTADARDAEVPPGAGDWIFVGVVAAATVGTFALLVPWSLGSGGGRGRVRKSALTLSITALVLSFVLFWTMVPVMLGSAGAWLGYVERDRSKDAGGPIGLATATIVLGVVAVVGSVAAYVATS